MSKIEGVAKKFDGTAIDYVSIFNWDDGRCIAQVVPDALGAWEYAYSGDVKVGITYVADGCEPITHGSYEFFGGIPSGEILHYSFNGDMLDQSINALHGVKSGSMVYDVGRKEGTQALRFIDGLVKTNAVLPINSDAVTVSFWMKSSKKSFNVLYQTTENLNSYQGAFGGYINGNGVEDSFHSISVNANSSQSNINAYPLLLDGTWKHIVATIDRSKPMTEQIKAYINNETSTAFADSQQRTDLIGDFVNHIFTIGGRASPKNNFIGSLQDFRVYNRILNASERSALYNE